MGVGWVYVDGSSAYSGGSSTLGLAQTSVQWAPRQHDNEVELRKWKKELLLLPPSGAGRTTVAASLHGGKYQNYKLQTFKSLWLHFLTTLKYCHIWPKMLLCNCYLLMNVNRFQLPPKTLAPCSCTLAQIYTGACQ